MLHIYIYILAALSSLTLISGTILSSDHAIANDAVDEVSITVPISCSMIGTGMNSHTAEIANGTYEANIGTTTLKAFCNDNEGFAIYAIGYTDDIDGKNVLTNSTLGSTHDIVTGTATSGPASNWAMKLATDSEATYPVTLQNGFNAYRTVPDDYTLVAKRLSGTDIGQTAVGASLTTTYQAYISQTQPAGTYTGQVKYVLVHPNDANLPVGEDQVAIVFHDNGLGFASGRSTNRVIYGMTSEDAYATIGDEYETSKTINVDENGEKISQTPYVEACDLGDYITIDGADMLKIVISYSMGDYYNNNELIIMDDYGFSETFINTSGTNEVFYVMGDSVEFYYYVCADTDDFFNYYYAKIYPVYFADESDEGAISVELPGSYQAISGTYAETTTWKGKWYGDHTYEYEDCEWDDGLEEDICTMKTETYTTWFNNQNEVIDYIINSEDTILGTTIDLYAYNPYTIMYHYNDNNAVEQRMMYESTGWDCEWDDELQDDVCTGEKSTHELYNAYDELQNEVVLDSPNHSKSGYGFAGWSENPNATVNGSDTIFGPNETIGFNDLTFNNTKSTTLYAVWVPSSGTMQNFSCSSLSAGQVTALTDSRDNNVYTVGKMQDGNCWMMENLRLDAEYSSDSTKAQGFGGVFAGLADSEPYGSYLDVQANSLYSIDGSTENVISGGNADRFPRYNNDNTRIGDDSLIANPTNIYFNSQWYAYGNAYSWAAAMANTDPLETTSASESANTSICPTGWTLPYGGSTGNGATSGGYYYLGASMGANNGDGALWRSYPNNYVYMEDVYEGASSSSYTTRSVDNSGYGLVYYFDVGKYGGYSDFTTSKDNWLYVRCLAFGSE